MIEGVKIEYRGNRKDVELFAKFPAELWNYMQVQVEKASAQGGWKRYLQEVNNWVPLFYSTITRATGEGEEPLVCYKGIFAWGCARENAEAAGRASMKILEVLEKAQKATRKQIKAKCQARKKKEETHVAA